MSIERGSKRNVVSDPGETCSGFDDCKLILPGEGEGGTAGTQPRRGIVRWAHRHDERGAWSGGSTPLAPATSDDRPNALENPGGLGAGPQTKKSQSTFCPLRIEKPQVAPWGWKDPCHQPLYSGANQ